jgi:hypothetical protein
MHQAKFSLSPNQIDFVNRHQAWGYPDKSSLVRAALDELKAKLARERLAESARLYAEVYAEDKELRELTEAALEDWPQ